MNDDQSFGDDFLSLALEQLQSHPRALLLPQGYDAETGERLPLEGGIHFDPQAFTFEEATRSEEVNCLSTRALFMRAADMQELGGFRPRFLPHYLSDYEFTLRAHRKGFRLIAVLEPKLFIQTEKTAVRGLKHLHGLREKLKYAFSPKYPGNPLHFSAFAMMATPMATWPKALRQIWFGWL